MTIHLEDLLGRPVRSRDGRVIGRIEEICAERRGDVHEVTSFHIGPAALLERLAITRTLLRRKPETIVARWDQIDVRAPASIRLTCDARDLKKL